MILHLSHAGGVEINYHTFYVLLTERDAKNVELSTPDLDKELIIRLITLEKCLFTEVKGKASLISQCGKRLGVVVQY